MLTNFRNKFTFYGLPVDVLSSSEEVSSKLDKDFSFFKSSEQKLDTFLEVKIEKVAPPLHKIPELTATFDRKYSTTYDLKNIRYNNYKNLALTIIDYEAEEVEIYSENEGLLHELAYLIILSRVGKRLDLMGLHRIHGMGVRVGKVDCIFMMEMGGGKSTLLSHLLNYSDIEFISDDSPLVDGRGKILTFPLRLGAYTEIINDVVDPHENVYLIERQEFGVKQLISINGIQNKIAERRDGQRQLFIQGKRVKGNQFRMLKANLFQKIYYLSYNMVIGIGLPMIFEYFWETGVRDFFKKSKIALYRSKAMFQIIFKNDFYIFENGESPNSNAEFLYHFLKEK